MQRLLLAVAGETRDRGLIALEAYATLIERPDAPHLAGQPAIYVSKVLNEFKAGTRRHEVMSVIARTLSAEDIGNVAAWYESIVVSVTLPAQ